MLYITQEVEVTFSVDEDEMIDRLSEEMTGVELLNAMNPDPESIASFLRQDPELKQRVLDELGCRTVTERVVADLKDRRELVEYLSYRHNEIMSKFRDGVNPGMLEEYRIWLTDRALDACKEDQTLLRLHGGMIMRQALNI
jgi:hypothetical protein